VDTERTVEGEPTIRKRPSGVWVLCALNIWLGFVSAAGTIILWVVPEAREALNPNTLASLFSFTLGISLIVFSILAWRGHRISLNVMLVLVSIYLTLIVWNNVELLYAEELDSVQHTEVIITIIRSCLFLVVNWWYFKSSRTKAFYVRS
jgi:hypothetical protein